MNNKRSRSTSRASMEPLRTHNKNASRLSGAIGGAGRISTTGRTSFAKPMSNVTGQVRRSSSQFGRHGRTEKKDPRQVTDRAFQKRATEQLIEHLNSAGYPHEISPKILHLPQTKEFMKIFEFLYSSFVPNYVLPRKFDELIPKLIKELGYPFNITKSYFANVGSPHSWPHVLAILHWLVNVIELSHVDSEIDLIFPQNEFDASEVDRLRFISLVDGYQRFLNNEDDEDTELDGYSGDLDRLINSGESLEQLKQTNIGLNEELNNLLEMPDPLQAELVKKNAMESDLQKYIVYRKELVSAVEKMHRRIEVAEQKKAMILSEIRDREREIQSMEVMISQQEYSIADVQRLQNKHDHLKTELDTLRVQIDTIYNDVWEEEMKMAKADTTIATELAQYNERARHLMATENCENIDLEIRYIGDAQRFNTVIWPILEDIKLRKEGELMKGRQKSQGIRDMRDQISDMTQRHNMDLERMETQRKRHQHEQECSKEVWNKKVEMLSIEVDQMSTDAINQDHRKKMEQLSQEFECKEYKKQCEERLAAKRKEVQDYKDIAEATADMAVEAKLKLEKAIDDDTEKIAQGTAQINADTAARMIALGLGHLFPNV